MKPQISDQKPLFDTDQVVIRATEPDDFTYVRDIYAQSGAYSGTLQMPHPTAHSWKERLANPMTGFRSYVACIEDLPIGNIGLMVDGNPRRRHAANIGMGVHDAYAGRGVGQLLMNTVIDISDNWLNLIRLELTVYTDNKRAISLYERCGFVTEGTLRQYAYRNGDWVDAYSMARIR